MTPEGQIKAKIDAVLKDRPGTWYFKPVQTGYGTRALDYIGCTYGYFWAIEAKRDSKDPTQFQRITILNMLRADGKVFKISGTEGLRAFTVWLDSMQPCIPKAGKVERIRFLQFQKI